MISGLISIGIFLIIQLVAAVWWASSVSTKMSFVLHEVKGARAVEKEILSMLERYSTKQEVQTALIAHEKEVDMALGFANKEMKAMWDKIDNIQKAIDFKSINK